MTPERQGPAGRNGQGPLLTYAVLTGLTPLIPIPFVDDLAKGYFRRALVRNLAAAQGISLDRAAVDVVAAEAEGCFVTGCLGQILIYPLKVIFRKLFYFLEWKRALDLTSQTYHFGYLVQCALQEGYLGPNATRRPADVRAAIEAVCREAPIKPIEGAVAATFRQSRNALREAVRTFERSLRGLRGQPDQRAVDESLGAVEETEKQEVAGVAEALGKRLQSVPDSHFRSLREQLRSRLG